MMQIIECGFEKYGRSADHAIKQTSEIIRSASVGGRSQRLFGR
jgi:hypothetical protein